MLTPNRALRDWLYPFGLIPWHNGLANPNEAMARRVDAYNRQPPYFWLGAEAERA